jgi:hypothetical protein
MPNLKKAVMSRLKDMTDFQKIVQGFKIFEEYLDPNDNPGEIAAEHDEIFVVGVHKDALGGDHREKLEAMDWSWDKRHECWKHFV